MSNLKAKLKKQGGFTLVEMLIVVAIIAILIAIAIPLVNSSLERAREATDAANERAAIGLAMVEFLGDKKAVDTTSGIGIDGGTGYYKVENSKGTLVKTQGTDITFKYGKGTTAGDVNADNAGKCVEVTVDGSGNVTTAWK